MSPDSIPQISLGTAALVIFAACAGFVMLRGMTRMIVGTIVLALSAWIAFIVWQSAPAVSFDWFGKPVAAVTNGLPVVAFMGAFFLLRMLLKAIVSPFGRSTAEPREDSSTIIRLSFRLLFALIPTALIWLIGATLIHHAGSVAEVRAHAEESIGIREATPAKFSQRLKDSVAAAMPESWLRFLDPLAEPGRLELAKFIATHPQGTLEPVIDPATGQLIPRAIIVEDPRLQNLAREGKFGTLLRHPLLTKAMEDPKVQALLKDPNP
jgi:hypothetical protein